MQSLQHNTKYWGYQFILDCSQCNPAMMADRNNVDAWIRKLVKDIDMQPIGEPRIEYTAAEYPDKAGFTVIQVIVTSSIVAHFVDNLGQIYLDVFSCKSFDRELVKQSVDDFFKCKKYREYFLTRQAD
jgi:S-adenosylmethionine/arginine decarboxylase-like enzyme